MDIGELLTLWTARLAVALYAVALGWRRPGRIGLSRTLWSAGCAMYLIHVGCAFHFVHHWSHGEAYAATARKTHALTGLDWGGGLYVNYLFTLVWIADTAWWWLDRSGYEARPRTIEWPVQVFLAFIAFNATVVFAEGPTRWIGLAGTVILLAIWLRRSIRRRDMGDPCGTP